MTSLANALAKLLATETEASVIALAWFVRNRLECGETFQNVTSAIEELHRKQKIKHGCDGTGVLSAIGILVQVFDGSLPDPTSNATKFHRHDEYPVWACEAEPSALIGSFLYYIDRPHSLKKTT
ncbi:MAG: hypothetical protein ACR2OR_15250 [Hyphomicrobiales bacterium]